MYGHPNSEWTRKDLKRHLYRAVTNVNILEGIRFYVSFACTFAFGELKLMEGSAKIVSLIARDENQHLVLTQQILKKWQDGDDPDMIDIMKEEEEYVYDMFKEAIKYYVHLPIPANVNDTSACQWGADTLNFFELAGLGIGQAVVGSDNAAEEVGTAVKILTGNVKIPGLAEFVLKF